jgi:sensor domain CHASE-containing protein
LRADNVVRGDAGSVRTRLRHSVEGPPTMLTKLRIVHKILVLVGMLVTARAEFELIESAGLPGSVRS